MVGSASGAGSFVVFSGNTVTGNTTGGANGAGAFLSGPGTVTVTNNVFRGNVLGATTGSSPTGFGGGLVVEAPGAGAQVVQSHNLFDSNVIHTQTFEVDGSTAHDYGGGGEYALAPLVTSTDDVFTNNLVEAGGGGNTAFGGAFGLQGNASNKTTLNAYNMVAANNSVGAAGEGGAIYAGFSVGCQTPPCTAEADVFDSTLTANSVGAAGVGQEMAGEATDTARVVNSIVTGPIGNQTDVAGFGTIAISYSDACVNGAAAAGAGNVCTDPKLANVAGNNVHETAASPTIDTGDSAQVAAALTQDYEGDGRVLGAAVDMGADEFVPPAPVLPAAGSGPGSPTAPPWTPIAFGVVAIAVVGEATRRRRSRRTG